MSLYDHACVFVDESGDLGFSDRSSKHLVVVSLATDKPWMLGRIVRKAYRRFGLKGKDLAEFKFNRSSELVRRLFLEGIAQTNSVVTWFGIKKSCLPTFLQSEPDEVWQLVALGAVTGLVSRVHSKGFHIVVDRRSVKSNTRRTFTRRLEREVSVHHTGYFPPAVTVTHLDSQRCDGLKMVDHIAGAVFRSVERGDDYYLDLISERVIYGRLES